MPSITRWRALFLIALGLLALRGRLAAGAAAAGAGTEIHLTTRGAESLVEGSVEDVAQRARAVFEDEGIAVTGSRIEEGGGVPPPTRAA